MLTLILLIISSLSSLIHGYSPTEPLQSLSGITHDHITFSAPLIHRSSPESPFFDPNYTRENYIEDGVLDSHARSQYFGQMKASTKGYVAAPLSRTSLLMKYTMGTPPVTSYGIFDTGSSFTWVQCLPCEHCYDQGSFPLFNTDNSSSYEPVLCYDPSCLMGPKCSCGDFYSSEPDLCLYKIGYMDGTRSRGVVATETITLSAENISSTFPKVVFGCVYDNQDKSKLPGMVGVGNGSGSLIKQLSFSHFSYYIFVNSSHIEGMVHFGRGASMSSIGMTTPLVPSDRGNYCLNLTGISVDGSDLDLPPGIFDTFINDDGYRGGFIIDSGTMFTILRFEAFDMLVSAIKDEMYEHTPESTNRFELCYKDVSEAPEVVFQFSGLDFIICNANLWIKDRNLYCLAMHRPKNREHKKSILGVYQQLHVQVGYDLENNFLSLFYPGACPDDADLFL